MNGRVDLGNGCVVVFQRQEKPADNERRIEESHREIARLLYEIHVQPKETAE